MDVPDRPDLRERSDERNRPVDAAEPMSVPSTEAAPEHPKADPGSSAPSVEVPETLPNPVHVSRGPNEIPLGGVLLAVLVGLALVGQDHWRRGLLLAGIGLLAGAVVRLVLPARMVGLLAVRGRVFDAVVLAILGTAVIALTSSVPLPPGSG
ncbi:MAG TPA: DUF3017 domain-containing protein [Frankiaceae bacterium]|nr:DUF3017 domain-containing protein [Frankiaceae bacterium]